MIKNGGDATEERGLPLVDAARRNDVKPYGQGADDPDA